jgi:hypothetical protein
MNLIVAFEALKFYKVKSEKVIQRWFIVLYLINISIWFVPFADSDFTAAFQALNSIAAGEAASFMLTKGNWVFIGLMLLVQLINLLFTFMYAALFVRERVDINRSGSAKSMAHALPRLILLLLLLLFPAILSMFMLMIPLIVFAAMMYFLPLNLMLDKSGLADGMQLSFRQSKGFRLLIFIQVMFLSLLVTFPESIIIGFFPDNVTASILIQSFFSVLLAFSQGRLMGILYLYIVKKQTVVLTSKPNDRTRE